MKAGRPAERSEAEAQRFSPQNLPSFKRNGVLQSEARLYLRDFHSQQNGRRFGCKPVPCRAKRGRSSSVFAAETDRDLSEN